MTLLSKPYNEVHKQHFSDFAGIQLAFAKDNSAIHKIKGLIEQSENNLADYICKQSNISKEEFKSRFEAIKSQYAAKFEFIDTLNGIKEDVLDIYFKNAYLLELLKQQSADLVEVERKNELLLTENKRLFEKCNNLEKEIKL